MLFNKRLLQTHLNNFEFPQEYDFDRAFKIISTWQESIKNGNYDRTNEIKVQSAFLNKFFNVILGYAEMHDSPDEWFLDNEAKTELDSTKADGALGFFQKDESQNVTRAVIELKDAKTPLDKKQASRKDYDSPVSQAFSYSSKFDRCDWIIVANFKEIRLYHKDRGQGYFESFEILNLDDEKEFKRFYFLFCKQNLLDKNRNSLLDNLVKDTSKNEEDITKQFYKDFKELRQKLFVHICENNPDIDKKCILEKTQKLLDRLIFIMFCEDSANLLPINTLKNYYVTGKNLPIQGDEKVYPIIRGLFHSIDQGNSDVKPPINKYNGGLFAKDELLDNLKIKDVVWESVINLADYDFESDLNVNILGHIFEQSLSDLEQIKAEIDGVEQDKTKSKRKKDGIFYTPEYITRYIVEQTVGKYLEENPDKLETIKILDPACGSGAFLNQAHSFLLQEHRVRTEEKIANEKARKSKGQEYVALNLFKHSDMAYADKSILLNNIYGVDLNEESTEITKLALWLKTAKKDQPLQNLDNNIKCGNSLIDDPEIACEKAFNWNEQFKDIMDDGGFDCIIGNPPYVKARDSKDDLSRKFIEANYISASKMWDLYIPFIEKGLKLLKPNGYLSMIIPDTIGVADYSLNLVEFIEANYSLVQIDFFPNIYVFENVGVRSKIIIIKNAKSNEKTQRVTHNESLSNITLLDKIDGLEKYKFETAKLQICLNNTVPLSNICLVSYGLRLNSDKDDKEFKFKKQDLISTEKNSINNRLYTEGKYLNRYSLEKLLYVEWGTERCPKRLVRATFPELYDTKRLLLSRQKRIAAYTDFNLVCDNTIIMAILAKDLKDVDNNNIKKYYQNLELNRQEIEGFSENFDLKYILAIINSRLISYFIKYSSKADIDFYPDDWKKIPIKNVGIEQQTSLANKAEQMIELNKQLHEGVKSALDLLQAEYQPKKISQKLETFYTLGQHPFLEELAKQGVKLSLPQKEELLKWYQQKSETLTALKTKIDTLDHSIDQEVYKLYNLTEEEIKIIEGE